MPDPNRYSTLAVDPTRRFDYWRDVVCQHCLKADSQPASPSDFCGTLGVKGIGALELYTLSSPLHHWQRDDRHRRCDPNDDLWLSFSAQGFGRFEQSGRRVSVAAGDVFLYDADQCFRFSLGGTENHLLRIPRRWLAARVPGIEQRTATVLDDRRPGVLPLRSMLAQAAEHATLGDGALSARYAETLLDLLVLSLEWQDLTVTHGELDLYGRAMRYIREHLADPELSLERIAQVHHVSTRTVTRAFARHQKTPVAAIWQERLDSSRRALEAGQVKSISQAALEHGFSDFSHYSHAFRKAYGMAPCSLLKRP
ncbi:helix-turn-helix domain-containing protein [Pseudomonas sp. S75]|uniref:AraC-like ligand-binding domain-containing protein n=1 Tax=unclassified Pseudomonas TaxID=196821 RepID=UPI0019048A10|nr:MULTISPECIES: helix-turn-helix domain-containing protein [unclassified Pseudomonas]MBJ9976594.1 helix-turn-helix domain-containing protein [Pseudomonas sp. S30]MBK0154410.1 helix-turn-helix domain-containing protein [Pseudomonas sp. S75]